MDRLMTVHGEIQAVPSVYGGVEFRSRLEARWLCSLMRLVLSGIMNLKVTNFVVVGIFQISICPV